MRLHVRGTVLPSGEERDLFVTDDRRLTFRGDEDARTVLDGGFLTPGLADAHCHLTLYSPAGDYAPDDERARASARAELDIAIEAGAGTIEHGFALSPSRAAPMAAAG